MRENNIEWHVSSDFPSELNEAQNNNSVDVLIYFECLDEHTIGWFNFRQMRWLFLSNQDYNGRRFKWRYFLDDIDKSYFKKDGKTNKTN